MMTGVWRIQRWRIRIAAMMSYLFTLSPGTFRSSDHLIAHILAISMLGPGEHLCSHGELLGAFKGPERSLTLGPGNYHERQRGW